MPKLDFLCATIWKIKEGPNEPPLPLGLICYKEGSMAERLRVLIPNLEAPSSSPPPTGHPAANSLLVDLPVSWGFYCV